MLTSPYNAFNNNKQFGPIAGFNNFYNIQDEKIFVRTLFGEVDSLILKYYKILPNCRIFFGYFILERICKKNGFYMGV